MQSILTSQFTVRPFADAKLAPSLVLPSPVTKLFNIKIDELKNDVPPSNQIPRSSLVLQQN